MRLALCVALALSGGCAAVDPAIQPAGPSHHLGLGVSGGLVRDEADPWNARNGPGPLGGLEAAWHKGLLGVVQGVEVFGEGRAVRVASSTLLTVTHVVEFGVGLRVGGLFGDPRPERPRVAVDTLLHVGLPVALEADLTLVPWVRPGLRWLENTRGDTDLRGFHAFGVTLRWTYARF
jgi:hypothetical protein